MQYDFISHTFALVSFLLEPSNMDFKLKILVYLLN